MKLPTRHSKPNSARNIVAVIAMAASVTMGCSNVPAPDAALVPADAAPLAEPVTARRIGVLPVMLDAEFAAYVEAANRAAGEPRRAYPPAPEFGREFAEKLVAALKQLRVADDVRFVPVGEGRRLDAVLAAAWDDGLDLVIRPVLRRHECRHIAHADAYVPNLIVWFLIPSFVTWWVADETFAGETALALEIFSTLGDGRAPVIAHEISGRAQHDLNDFDQGFNFFDIFITPSGLSESHWHDIGGKLLPLAEQACQRAIIEWCCDREAGLAAAMAASASDWQRTLAIVIGGPAVENRAPRMAIDDARRITATLARADGGDVPLIPRRALLALDGATTTREEIFAAIRTHLADRARNGDRALVVLVGQGVIDRSGNSFLLLAGTNAENLPATALPIAELARALKSVPGRTAIVAAIGWRALNEMAVDLATADPLAALRPLDSAVIFDAAPAGQSLLEMEQIGGSLFVREWLRALQSSRETDANGDGWMSWREIAERIAGPITEFSRLDGSLQTPMLSGSEAAQAAPFFPARPSTAATPSR